MSATSAPAREPKAKSLPKSALSLRPNEAVMQGAAQGDPYAIAIRDAWRFNEPIRSVTQEEFARISAAGTVTFHG